MSSVNTGTVHQYHWTQKSDSQNSLYVNTPFLFMSIIFGKCNFPSRFFFSLSLRFSMWNFLIINSCVMSTYTKYIRDLFLNATYLFVICNNKIYIGIMTEYTRLIRGGTNIHFWNCMPFAYKVYCVYFF